MSRLALFCFLLSLPAQWARGQVELIVRPTDGAAAEFVRAIERFPAKSARLDPQLFADVQAVHPIFVPPANGAKAGAPVPFTAFTLVVPDSARYRALKARWARRPDVKYVEPNAVYELDAASSVRGARGAPPDPLADSLNHLDVVRAREAWDLSTGAGVRIGLVDTGLDLDHPDLAPQRWVNPGEDLNSNGRVDDGDFNGVDDDGNGWVDDLGGYDFVDRPNEVEAGDYRDRDPDPSADPDGAASGHATTVAGVMAAARGNGEGIAGVAPDSRIVPLRAFGSDGRGATDDIAAAIVYAAEMGLDVINLSFGRDHASPLLEESIQYAVGQGTVVVASAGNNGGDEPHYPSDYPETIAVAWLNADGTDIAFRGEYGLGIDLGAPGTGIYTTLQVPVDASPPMTEDRYGRQSGSSVAAPLVTGAVALLRAFDPMLSPAAIRSILTASAVDLGAPGWDHRTGAGRLDAAAALARALPARTAISAPAHDGGTAAEALPVVGSALDPSFASYSVYYAEGTEDLDGEPDPWTRIAGPVDRQVYEDTLAVLPAGDLDEGVYTLRLVTTLRSGRTVEDRRRLYVDRTPPQITPQVVRDGLVGGAHGVVLDLETDDVTTARMRVTLDGATKTIPSEVRNRRHGLAWADTRGAGGTAAVRVDLTNPSGLTSRYDTTLQIPRRRVNTALFEETALDVPHGFLLPAATDFDDDGLREIVFNRYEDGALGDTLRAFEWDGSGFSSSDTLIANVIPRDVGDTDGDGRRELLTQVAAATLLLEQPDEGGFPTQEQFIDTTGLGQPDDSDAVWGAQITDLDGDGRGEILAHNRAEWRVLEWGGDGYAEVARLENPTGAAGADPATTPNGFQEPRALVDDFDGDGRIELLVGDNDGDWIIYEATGDDRFEVEWTHETRRINAGARFAKGDFDGDGQVDFVTYTENLPVLTEDGAREPPIGLYHFWETHGDGDYRRTRVLPVQGNVSRNGSITAADFDGDGRDEVVIAHPPDLYVLAYDAQDGWRMRYHRGVRGAPGAGLRSAAMVAADFSGNGTPELVAGTADEALHLWRFQSAAADRPPPQWVAAHARSDASVVLAWQAPGADSVEVLSGPPEGDLDPLTARTDSSMTRAVAVERRYALRAWYDGDGSPLSASRLVRPHAPATVQDVSYPTPRSVALRFSEPLAPSTQPDQFQLAEGGAPVSLLPASGARGVVLRFEAPPHPREGVLRWTGVRDVEGTPVGQDSVAVVFPAPAPETLVIAQWEARGPQSVALEFSAPLQPAPARDPAHYRLTPHGEVAQVRFNEDAPTRVELDLREVVVGAVGAEVALRVTELRSVEGARLAEEGASVRLVEPADDLAEVYVYPNPYRARRHDPFVTIAGLPAEATVRILSPQGLLVQVLTESGRDGGLRWNLEDRTGRRVPSGVYLIRVESPDQNPVLRKAAIIR